MAFRDESANANEETKNEERMKANQDNMFADFLGKDIKAPYRDGDQLKIARGKLESINNGFVKIRGRLGTIIINEKNIEKMSRANVNERIASANA